MWSEITDEINAIINRSYWTKDDKQEVKDKRKKENMKHILRWLVSWLLKAHGTRATVLKSIINSNTSDIWTQLKNWGLDFNKILDYSSQEVSDWKADDKISEYVNILIGNKSWSMTSDIDDAVFWTQQAANDIFTWTQQAENDEHYDWDIRQAS